jgi:hypothetical protein
LLNAALAAMLFLIAAGQSSSAGTTASFPAMLAGGSRGVPLSLPGTLYLSEARLEFEAFPQIENVTLPCTVIKSVDYARHNKSVVTIVSAGSTYQFDLRSASQAQLLLDGLVSRCSDLPKKTSVHR